jgi:hypothetical protein
MIPDALIVARISIMLVLLCHGHLVRCAGWLVCWAPCGCRVSCVVCRVSCARARPVLRRCPVYRSPIATLDHIITRLCTTLSQRRNDHKTCLPSSLFTPLLLGVGLHTSRAHEAETGSLKKGRKFGLTRTLCRHVGRYYTGLS